MELAFMGSLLRGENIKNILQNLGGKDSGYSCAAVGHYYYINKHGNIEGSSVLPKDTYWKIYSIKKFEKEFPYKVGDVVTYFDRNNKTIHLLIQNIRWNPTKHGGTLEYVLQNGIITTEENLKPMKKELKDYLKPGYVVEHKDGLKYIITQDVHGNNFGLQLGAARLWSSLENLTLIVKVYQIDSPGALHEAYIQDRHLTLVWERKEVELTMQEIADKFGIDVNQLKIKK